MAIADTSNKNTLDPMRVILGILANGSSDTLVRIASVAGLTVELSLTEAQAFSHGTRLRALLPRVQETYDLLDDESKLAAASIAATEVARTSPEMGSRLAQALSRIGWGIEGDHLVPSGSDVRELFFPKGSPWDAFVALRQLFSEAKAEILVIDPYCDGTVFQLLAARDLNGLTIRLLCSKYGPTVAAEAKKFVEQFPGATVEVRCSRDFHDRFIILDAESCVHIGASINHAGKTAFMISKVEDARNRTALLRCALDSWDSGVPVA